MLRKSAHKKTQILTTKEIAGPEGMASDEESELDRLLTDEGENER